MKIISTLRREFLSCRSSGRLAIAIVLLAVGKNSAWSQTTQQPFVTGLQTGSLGRPYPSPLYFQAFPALNDGDYKAAGDQFRREAAGGLKIGATRWIDSVCGYTMAGECLYRQGNYTQALENFTAALQLYAQYYDWMIKVQFPDNVAIAGIKPAPWGKSTRGARPGVFRETYPISVGQTPAETNSVVQRGGTVIPQQVLPMNVQEIVRCTCLAMYRRGELLGPLVSFDSLTDDLVSKASRRSGRPNHWSEAWIDVQQGMAYSSAGKTGQAIPLLQRSLLAQGQCDHPLTGIALLELGRLSMNSGDYKTAAGYFEEATYTGYDYSDGMVMEEGFRNLFLAHYLMGDVQTLDVALATAAAWAKGSFRELQASVMLLAAESLALRGQTSQATGLLADASNVIARRVMGLCEIGSRLHYLTAMTSYQRAEAVSGEKSQPMVTLGDNELKTALAWQETGCRKLFQINLADKLCTTNPGGRFGTRAALALYAELLRDPTPSEWNMRPLESLAIMSAKHTEQYEHWFETVVQQDPQAASEMAIEVADLARRHRFLTSLPLGGRLMALRWTLESPADSLHNQSKLQRQELLAKYPKYVELGEKIKQLRADLAANGLTFDTAEAQRSAGVKYTELTNLANAQETILREMSVRREAADIIFPPIPKMKVVQKMLAPGQLLLTFFTTSHATHGWLFSSDRYAIWKLENPAVLDKKTAALLKAIGNFDGTRELQENQLAEEGWKQASRDVLEALLKNSKINFNTGINELIIVPDGSLWYLPFEMLPLGDPKDYHPLIPKIRVRYAPTVGLSLPIREGRKPNATMGVVVGKLYPNDNAETIEANWEEVKRASDHVVALRGTLPGTSPVVATQLDSLVVLDDVPTGQGAFDWSPMPTDRAKGVGALANWMMLPWKNVDQFVLPGFHTAAENGLKMVNPAPGMEMFLATTGLMSTGARTILISRWRTGGHTAMQLIREFVQELPFSTADAAWQRAVDLVTKSPLDPLREPRIRRKQDAAPLNADHPFFWAGYMLVDTGASPEKDPAAAAQPEKKILKFEEKKRPGAAQPEKKADEKPAESNAEKKMEAAAPAKQDDAPALPQPPADTAGAKN